MVYGVSILLIFKCHSHKLHSKPVLHSVSSPKALNTSNLEWFNTVVLLSEPLDRPTYSHIDVRDLALFHVLALSTEKAGGERFIVTAGLELPFF
jgi:hypothetical protein